MNSLPPISSVASNITVHSWEDIRSKVATASFTVFYSRTTGWQIIEKGGGIYTPQAFESEYGYLPDIGDFKWCHKHRRKQKIKEWYAHRHQKTSNTDSGRGFGKC